ncbi:MAG: 8-amino-7-oxononanoate synthase [Porphyromonas sp.]|nr:8-amino-7-oxononanoate synthase [Porphyromonas sp.]
MTLYERSQAKLQRSSNHRVLAPYDLIGKEITLEGGHRCLNLSSNDYLGLQEERGLWHEFLETEAPHHAPSSSSSRLLTGNAPVYWEFEEHLSQLYNAESALLWDSGYHANSGIIPVLADGKVLILADRLVHASIIDGIRLSPKCHFTRFRHNDLEHLGHLLEERSSDYDATWIITESLFSMDGDVAPLKELVTLKKRFPNTYLYLDEAHAVGVFGERGLGLAEAEGLLSEIDLVVGTLGKALCSVGAYSIQSDAIHDLLINHARPLIFSTALPPITVAWSHFILDRVLKMKERREHLRKLTEVLVPGHPSQIIPIIVPGNEAVQEAAEEFIRAGFYVRPIRKPTVPAGKERLRLSLTASMTLKELNSLQQLTRKYL